MLNKDLVVFKEDHEINIANTQKAFEKAKEIREEKRAIDLLFKEVRMSH